MAISRAAAVTVSIIGGAAGVASVILGLWISTSDVPSVRGAESNVVFSVQKLVAGRPLYQNPEAVPFDVTQYTPLYYLLAREAARPGDATEAGEVTARCRLLSLVLTGVLLGMCVRLLRRMGAGLAPSLTVVACLAAVTAPWYYLARPDSLLALCLLGALGSALLDLERQGRLSTAAVLRATLWCAAAIAAKQSGVQAYLILALFLLITRDLRRLALSAALLLAVGGAGALVAHTWLGDALVANTIRGIDNGTDLAIGFDKVYGPFLRAFLPVTLLALGLALRWLVTPAPAVEKLLAVALLVLFTFATATGVKVGAAIHYYNEFLLLSGLALGRLLARRPAVAQGATARLVALYLVVMLPWWTAISFQRSTENWREPGTWRARAGARYADMEELQGWLRERLAATPEARFLSMDKPVANLAPEACVAPQREIVLLANRQGAFHYGELRSMLRDGRIRFLVTRDQREPAAFLGESLTPFDVVARFPSHTVFEHARWQRPRR